MPITRKIVVMGFRGVGKTSITSQFLESNYDPAYTPTLEQSHAAMIRDGSGREFQTTIVDTAGQDEFTIVPNPKSKEVAEALSEKIWNAKGSKYPRVLVANKKDLANSGSNVVSGEEGRKLAEEWECPYFETSAKTNEAIAEVFTALMDEIQTMNGGTQEKKPDGCEIL